ncbi:centrosomal protein of 97 kDa [Planococcus citri]|uniref:centrosomal protein of 97 kDa n=1 Tax=Planococcus citri TaxID=170843 RepID=UPI0031F95D7D
MEGNGLLNLSNKQIRKLDKTVLPPNQTVPVISLNISGNCLQRLDNIDLFPELIELNASRNQLLRMYNLIKLHQLVKINLSNNHILSIEGLKELRNLKYLNLSYNNIKVLDANHLQTNIFLEHADLSHNRIVHITNISHLTSLKVLHLHKNQIANLRHCEMFLPGSLEILTLANNNITDLNEISHLVQLCSLKELSVNGNPCVSMTGNNLGFDYRPFVLNWCMSLRCIDGFAVDDLESLKAEWLYSQGKGRKFRVGEHVALVQYLADTCPISGKTLESENERKLRLILSKAQQHQKQLGQDHPNSGVLRSASRRSLGSSSVMTRSLDPGVLSRKTSTVVSDECSSRSENFDEFSEKRLTKSAYYADTNRYYDSLPHSLKTPFTNGEPLPTSTALVPAPDSLISPSMAPSLPFYNNSLAQKSVEAVEEDEEPCPAKLKTIRTKAHKKQEQATNPNKKSDPNEAATCIQKMWRGYHTRILNRRVSNVYQQIQTTRFNQYIKKLSVDMEATRAALDKEHQLQVLQMEAINALWKKISALQASAEVGQNMVNSSAADKVNLKALASTCSQLDFQVQKLQNSMQEVLRRINTLSKGDNNAVISTQTEIIAVHTPKDENKLSFPYQKLPPRPSSLPLAITNSQSKIGSSEPLSKQKCEDTPVNNTNKNGNNNQSLKN